MLPVVCRMLSAELAAPVGEKTCWRSSMLLVLQEWSETCCDALPPLLCHPQVRAILPSVLSPASWRQPLPVAENPVVPRRLQPQKAVRLPPFVILTAALQSGSATFWPGALLLNEPALFAAPLRSQISNSRASPSALISSHQRPWH